tara:strand:+ start:8133 stop:9170 length:1038 start_codon:yes stop_codon:yes gene_type:complete
VSWWRIILVFILSFSVSSFAQAAGEGIDVVGSIPSWQTPETVGVAALGRGSAGTANGDTTTGLYLNPASLRKYLNTYVFEGTFSFHPSADSRVFNVALADSKSNALLAAGLAYSFFSAPREDDGESNVLLGHMVRLGLGMDWRRTLYVGILLKYFYVSRPFKLDNYGINADVGVIYEPHPWFSLSLVGYNLLYNDDNEIPISMAGGIGIGGDTPFRASIDGVVDFQSKGEPGYELRVGIQYTFVDIFTIRAGYQLDQVRDRRPFTPWLDETARELSHFVSVGIGLRYAMVGLDISFRQQLDAGTLSNNRYLGFSLQFWPYGTRPKRGQGGPRDIRAGSTQYSGGR